MTDSMSVLAKRANHVYNDRPGFSGCTVESEQPPVLAFDFTSAEAAEEFKFELEVQTPTMRMEIPRHRQTTVLQYR
jgi:hypothetical protein